MTDTTTATEGSTENSGGHAHLGWALVLISVAQLMVVLDSTLANIALPYIQDDLDISQANLQWVVTGYALAFGGCLLLGGRTGAPQPRSLPDRMGDLPGRPAFDVGRSLQVPPQRRLVAFPPG